MKLTTEQIEAAYAHTIRNRAELLKSHNCCCIDCRHIFPSEEVVDWIDDGQTAMCPYCDTDAVIGDASRYQFTEDFINPLHNEYFDYVID